MIVINFLQLLGEAKLVLYYLKGKNWNKQCIFYNGEDAL